MQLLTMNPLFPDKKIKVTHLYSEKLLFSIWVLSITLLSTNQIVNFIVAFLALISFIYSFIETRKGYIILETKNNHLTINNPFQKSGTLKINEIYHIKEEKIKELTLFNIHLKNKKIIQYRAPYFLYSNIPLFGNHEHKLALEKEIRQFFKEISDYLEQQHEKEP